jgi:hypothetical protein
MGTRLSFPISVAAAVFILSFSCSDKTTPSINYGTTTYPLTTGSRWQYSKISYIEPFNNPSYADTDFFAITRDIIGADTLIDTLNLTLVDDTVVALATQETTVTRWWYGIKQNLLGEYGYQVWRLGKPTIPQFYDSPHIILDFPLWNGKVWTSYLNLLGSVRRYVLRREIVSAGALQFSCDAVKSQQFDDLGHPSLPSSIEWFCDRGLIAVEVDRGIRIIADSLGNIVDSARAFDKQTLTSLAVQP